MSLACLLVSVYTHVHTCMATSLSPPEKKTQVAQILVRARLSQARGEKLSWARWSEISYRNQNFNELEKSIKKIK